ncbi:MAG: hypothetical protein OXG35_15925 [Acidobacteria bacterium]|nr:hypothetical protein [Acidobacteriota bacterium]
MPIQPIAGPAGSAKSQHVSEVRRPGDVLIDYTLIWAALTGAARGPDGRYPVREDDDPSLPLASAVYWFTLSEAVRRELSGFVTTASRAAVPRLERITGVAAHVLNVEASVPLARLSEVDPGTGDPTLEPSCVAALRRWYVDAAEIEGDVVRGSGRWRAPDGKSYRGRPRRGRRR